MKKSGGALMLHRTLESETGKGSGCTFIQITPTKESV